MSDPRPTMTNIVTYCDTCGQLVLATYHPSQDANERFICPKESTWKCPINDETEKAHYAQDPDAEQVEIELEWLVACDRYALIHETDPLVVEAMNHRSDGLRRLYARWKAEREAEKARRRSTGKKRIPSGPPTFICGRGSGGEIDRKQPSTGSSSGEADEGAAG